MPKIRGEIVCQLSDEQVLDMAGKTDWPAVFTVLPKKKNADKNESYVDPDMLPPSYSDYEDSD